MRFYVLDAHRPESPEQLLRETDVIKADGTQYGDPTLTCRHCNRTIGLRKWLAPYRVVLDTWGSHYDDMISVGQEFLVFLNIQTILSTIADNIYSNWIPLFLWEVHKLKFEKMGIYSALPLLGGAIAGLTGGLLNDWLIAWTGNRRWSRSGIAIFGKGMAAVVLLAAMFWYDSPYVFCWLLFVVKLFGDWSLTTSWGVVTDIGGRATASVFAFNNAVAGLGLIVAPVLFGSLAEHYGWRPVFVAVAATYVMCALSWLLIDCTIPVIGQSPEPQPYRAST